jgi:hypothetical protein
LTFALLAGIATAQDGGYHVGESSNSPPKPDAAATAPAPTEDTSGPVRMARVSYVNGSVTWRPDGDTDWTSATVNTPMRQGAQVWVSDGGRAEIQFDDGSVLRIGSGAVVTLQTLFSDTQGEFTEIKMTDGLASMDLRTDHSIYQIDTPHGSVKSVGPSQFRVGVDEDVEIGVRSGTATLDGPQGKLTMHEGDYVDVPDDKTAYEVKPLPAPDSWDRFTDERHSLLAQSDKNLPQNMQYMAGDIDRYGQWRDDSQYGKVWVPDEPSDWQPYHEGHWVWVDPFGWTWVGDEPWGWAPYHYGTWVHRPWGWAWVPGPVSQFWSPAVVSFSCYGDEVCWAPLSPWECVYPAPFGVGLFGPGWGVWFSIGCCGCWYPHGDHVCWGRPWGNHWVNQWHGWDHGHDHGWDAAAQHNLGGGEWSRYHFTPSNARWGASVASVHGFGVDNHYSTLRGATAQAAFSKGQQPGLSGHGEPLSGPVKVAQPSPRSWTPTRSAFTRPEEGNTGILNRATYKGTNRAGLTRSTTPAPLGEHYSAAAQAAAAARQSLGWTPRNSGTSSSGSSRGGFGGGFGGSSEGRQGGGTRGGSGFGGFGGRQTQTSQQRRSGWSVPDRTGWTHVHSSPAPTGSSRGSGSTSGGSRGGGGSGGHRG